MPNSISISKNPMDLTGERILVTGASSGIGKATAQLLSALGAQVVVLGRNKERLEQALKTLEGSGHSIEIFDLSEFDQIPSMLKRITQEGKSFSGIFHAAGIEFVMPVRLLKEKQINEVFNSNIRPMMALVRGFCKKGIRSETMCSIVLMSSVASLKGQSGMSLYSASKGAMDAAMRSMACELAESKIRINSIAAAAVETEMHQRLIQNMSMATLNGYQEKHLLGFGQVEDIANASAFLLSNASRWITGTTMIVDGGYTCR